MHSPFKYVIIINMTEIICQEQKIILHRRLNARGLRLHINRHGEIVLSLPTGQLTIKKNGDGYIKSITVNGKQSGFRISHKSLAGAGEISFRLK